jgi:hypothetical protein
MPESTQYLHFLPNEPILGMVSKPFIAVTSKWNGSEEDHGFFCPVCLHLQKYHLLFSNEFSVPDIKHFVWANGKLLSFLLVIDHSGVILWPE